MIDEGKTTAGRSIWRAMAMVMTAGLAWAGITWPDFSTADLALLLLIPVVVAASGSGRLAGVAFSIIAGGVFNFVALEPKLIFAIAKSGDLLTLCVYAMVALVTASVAARLAEMGQRAGIRR